MADQQGNLSGKGLKPKQLKSSEVIKKSLVLCKCSATPKPTLLLQLLNVVAHTQQCPKYAATKNANKPRPANQFPASSFSTRVAIILGGEVDST